jgi:hypothetical protein
MSKEERNHPAYEYGTDKQFLDWITYQPSIIDGSFNQYHPSRNLPCHVRRQKCGAGMGIKPPFSAVPMTHIQHMLQSGRDGEREVLMAYAGLHLSKEAAQAWFEARRDEMVNKWIASTHKKGIA